ncbi:MAG TPA: hypothetical protein VGI70_00805 [Polyangiales bacterium]
MRSSIHRTELDLQSARARRGTLALTAIAVLVLSLGAACGGGAPEIVAQSMPSGGNFTGVYFSPQYGEMNLMQNGSAVIGEYKQEMRSGKIQGEATGDLLKFEWTEQKAMVSNRAQEARGHGYFRYVIDKANGDHVLKGEWGLGDSATGGGPWNAYKAKGKEPHLSTETSGGESKSSDDESDDSSGSKPGNESGDDLF